MQFEWDEAKRQENLRKHRIDFVDVPAMLSGPMLTSLDLREEYGEDRWRGIGFLSSIVAVVVWAERVEDVIRIISARKATRQEREQYERYLRN